MSKRRDSVMPGMAPVGLKKGGAGSQRNLVPQKSFNARRGSIMPDAARLAVGASQFHNQDFERMYNCSGAQLSAAIIVLQKFSRKLLVCRSNMRVKRLREVMRRRQRKAAELDSREFSIGSELVRDLHQHTEDAVMAAFNALPAVRRNGVLRSQLCLGQRLLYAIDSLSTLVGCRTEAEACEEMATLLCDLIDGSQCDVYPVDASEHDTYLRVHFRGSPRVGVAGGVGTTERSHGPDTPRRERRLPAPRGWPRVGAVRLLFWGSPLPPFLRVGLRSILPPPPHPPERCRADVPLPFVLPLRRRHSHLPIHAKHTPFFSRLTGERGEAINESDFQSTPEGRSARVVQWTDRLRGGTRELLVSGANEEKVRLSRRHSAAACCEGAAPTAPTDRP